MYTINTNFSYCIAQENHNRYENAKTTKTDKNMQYMNNSYKIMCKENAKLLCYSTDL